MPVSRQPLRNLRVAILVDDGFEQVEMTKPREALMKSGANPVLVSPQKTHVRGWNHDDPADLFPVGETIARADPNTFDALLIPGGVRSPDRLRINSKCVLFVHAIAMARRPIAAICHGPWVLVEIDYVRGKRVTSFPSLRTDLSNAGATWVDEAVVVDELLATSRMPSDIPRFNRAIVELFTPRELAQTA